MGILRFLLALVVVSAHIHVGPLFGYPFAHGRLAVQVFYMISGFYMALVWTEKYSKLSNPIRTFYVSRALRIYPLYFIVLILTLLILGMGFAPAYPAIHLTEAITELGWLKAFWVYSTQITLIGMETPLLYDFKLNEYWLVPVAWSLGIELTFYLLVPFLLYRKSILISIIIFSLGIRVMAMGMAYFYDIGLNLHAYNDVWSYRFFPFEIAFFLIGALVYMIYSTLPEKSVSLLNTSKMYYLGLTGIIGGLIVFPTIHPFLRELAFWVYYAIAAMGIAILFHHTRKSKYDSYIGELSYPIYIVHFVILWITEAFLSGKDVVYVVIPVTILVGIVLCKIQGYIDDFRHNIVIKNR